MIKITSRTAVQLLFTTVILLGLGACSKSSDDPVVKSKTQLLTQATWKFIKFEEKVGAGGTWVDYTSTMPACEIDNNLIVNTNGTYESNEGASVCTMGDPQIIETGTWVFQNNETELKTTSTGSSTSDISTIEVLNESTFTITSSYVFSGTTYYDRITFGH